MKKYLFFPTAAVAVAGVAFWASAVNYDCSSLGTTDRSDRYVSSLTLSDNQGSESVTISDIQTSGTHEIYVDKSDHTFTTKPGAVVTITPGGIGTWTHSYAYIDWAGDGFSYTTPADYLEINESAEPANQYKLKAGVDLVAFTRWCPSNNEQYWYDTNGYVGQNTGNNIHNWDITTPFSFTIPANANPGTYRMRYKRAWNQLDPNGIPDIQLSNTLALDGGCIADFTLEITGEKEPVEVNYDLSSLGSQNDNNVGARWVSYVNLSAEGSEALKIGPAGGTDAPDLSKRYAIYHDFSDQVFGVEAGKTINVEVEGGGNLLQTYIYVDWGKDGFNYSQPSDLIDMGTYVPLPGSDLVAHNGWSESGSVSGTPWYDSKGNTVESPLYPTWPQTYEIAIPEGMEPGLYRARVKCAYCSLDPNGGKDDVTAAPNTIQNNIGTIVDFTIEVIEANETHWKNIGTANVYDPFLWIPFGKPGDTWNLQVSESVENPGVYKIYDIYTSCPSVLDGSFFLTDPEKGSYMIIDTREPDNVKVTEFALNVSHSVYGEYFFAQRDPGTCKSGIIRFPVGAIHFNLSEVNADINGYYNYNTVPYEIKLPNGIVDYDCSSLGTTSREDRYVSSLTLSDDQGSEAVTISDIQTSGTRNIYVDKSDQTFTTKPGAVVTITPGGAGSWIHSYAYIDWDGDGFLYTTPDDYMEINETADPADQYKLKSGVDLVAFTRWCPSNNEQYWYNTDGFVGQNTYYNIHNWDITTPFSFTIPADAKPGKYRMRYKSAWNQLDPNGVPDIQLNNTLASDGGCITDITLEISEAEITKDRETPPMIRPDFRNRLLTITQSESLRVALTIDGETQEVATPYTMEVDPQMSQVSAIALTEDANRLNSLPATFQLVFHKTPELKYDGHAICFLSGEDETMSEKSSVFVYLDGSLNKVLPYGGSLGISDFVNVTAHVESDSVFRSDDALMAINAFNTGRKAGVKDGHRLSEVFGTWGDSLESYKYLEVVGDIAREDMQYLATLPNLTTLHLGDSSIDPGNYESSRGLVLNKKLFGISIQELGIQANQSFSVAGWVKPTNLPDGISSFVTVENRAGSWPANNWDFFWSRITNEGKFVYDQVETAWGMRMGPGASGQRYWTQYDDAKIGLDTWTHFAIVFEYDGTSVRSIFYLNGVKQVATNWLYCLASNFMNATGEKNWDDLSQVFGKSGFTEHGSNTDTPPFKPSSWPVTNAHWISIGGTASNINAFDGVIDDYQVWGKAMTDDDVKAAMAGLDKDNLPADVLGYWDFEDEPAEDFSFAAAGSKKGAKAYFYEFAASVNEGVAGKIYAEPNFSSGCPFLGSSAYKIETVPERTAKRATITNVESTGVEGILAGSGIETIYSNVYPQGMLKGMKRLTTVMWGNADSKMPDGRITEAGNPNILLWVADRDNAPTDARNVVVWKNPNNEVISNPAATGVTGEAEAISLEAGYPFNACHPVEAKSVDFVKTFDKPTVIGKCRGWETIALPFTPEKILRENGDEIIPFSAWPGTDDAPRPFWLYTADGSDWQPASEIESGQPYIISMPNNPGYVNDYNIKGEVGFRASNVTLGTEDSAPKSTNWKESMLFNATFMPVKYESGMLSLNTMGEENGLPGSIFTDEAETLPFGAYVSEAGSRKRIPVFGGSGIELPEISTTGLTADSPAPGTIRISSLSDRYVTITAITGVTVAKVDVKAGENVCVNGLAKGIYIVAGIKIIVK